ncbi:MAG: DUF2911 domain-containing protein [Flavitalea sp.]
MLTANKGLIFYLLAMLVTLYSCKSKETGASVQSIQRIPASHPKNEEMTVSGVDKSPMDMSYYPVDYPVLKMTGKTTEPPIARLIYSRPFKDGRAIFGGLIKYGSHWRLGANEASEIEFFVPVKITGKIIKKGRYIIYCIPYEDKWTIILNGDLFTWGLKINASKDIYSFEIPVNKVQHVYEALTMEFEKTAEGMQLTIAWDNSQAALPIMF